MQVTSTLECIDEVVDVVEETNDETVSLIFGIGMIIF